MLVLATLAGLRLFALATQHGLGLGSDSAAYIAAGRNFVDGHGLSWLSGGREVRPLVLHAPLYPLMLAAFEALSIDSIPAARVVNGPLRPQCSPVWHSRYRLTLSWGFSSTDRDHGCDGRVFAVCLGDERSSYIALSLSALNLTVWYFGGRPLLLVTAALTPQPI
jgi:hypothetical protein